MSKNFFDRLTALVAAITAMFVVSLLLSWPLAYIWNNAVVVAFPFLGRLDTLQMLGVLFFLSIVSPPRSAQAIQLLGDRYLQAKQAENQSQDRQDKKGDH